MYDMTTILNALIQAFLLISLSSLQEQISRILEGQSKLFFEYWLIFFLFSVMMAPRWFYNVEVQALGRPINK